MNPLSRERSLDPRVFLRLGLGLVLLYAGLETFFDPGSWAMYVPGWLDGLVGLDTFLSAYAAMQILLGVLLLIGRFVAITSFVAFLVPLGVIAFHGITSTTFRDFGLMTAAAALFLLAKENTGGGGASPAGISQKS